MDMTCSFEAQIHTATSCNLQALREHGVPPPHFSEWIKTIGNSYHPMDLDPNLGFQIYIPSQILILFHKDQILILILKHPLNGPNMSTYLIQPSFLVGV